jgi:hypothetical protein
MAMAYVELAWVVVIVLLAANAWRNRGIAWALSWLLIGAVVWGAALLVGSML